MNPPQIQRYLALLETPPQPPSLPALAALVRAQLTHVPFENLSKVHRWQRTGLTGIPDLGTYLDGIDHHHFGGTCYANNYHFYSLLAALGHDVRLCGADMSRPDVHVVILARVDGREYLVDSGYGAPFLEPLPRDLDHDHVVPMGRDRYVLHPQDAAGRSRMELVRDGEPRHGYLVKPEARDIREFDAVVLDSFRPDATFLNALMMVRCHPGRTVAIRNLELLESTEGTGTARTLRDHEELVRAIEEHFGIDGGIAREVLKRLGKLRDVFE
ncbi:MAG: arylamine N-acetyltransferase [Candidatus Eisenbacteria bacterium]|nr:arylamine N-acetyltransferase [Candidatus Eisenbacteria bacterium]